jgi:hypothetical protein
MSAIVIPGLSAFDYSVLEPDVERLVRDAAKEIRSAGARHVDEALRMGRALLRVRKALPHGQFGKWLSAEGWAERTAQNYMAAADTFGTKSATVADLPLRIVYLLSASGTPDTARNQVIERLDRGERPGEQEIVAIIKNEREERRNAAIRARVTPEALKRQGRREARRRARLEKEEKASAAASENRRSAAREAAALVHARLGDDDLAVLFRLLDEADVWGFAMELRRLARGGS